MGKLNLLDLEENENDAPLETPVIGSKNNTSDVYDNHGTEKDNYDHD